MKESKSKRKTKRIKEKKKQRFTTVSLLTIIIIIVFVILIAIFNNSSSKNEENLTLSEQSNLIQEEIVRPSAVAGSWYPGTKTQIITEIQKYFENNQKNYTLKNRIDSLKAQHINAIIVPHAGWRFSGQVASGAFNAVCNKSYKTVIILAPSHHASFKGVSVGNFTHYETPLGKIKVSPITKNLLKEPLFSFYQTAHEKEHSIEIELPFLQYCLKDFEIVPILVGNFNSYSNLEQIANTLKKYIDEDTLIVVSSDFTHYGPNYNYVPFTQNIKENLEKLDSTAFNTIKELDPDKFYSFLEETGDTICGRYPILILLNILKDKKLNVTLISYDTSGNILKDYTNSVSYMSIAFSGKNNEQDEEKVIELTQEEKEFLLKLARQTLETYLTTGSKPEVDESQLTPTLKQKMGCFVTLEKNGMLRGCIGHILPQEELYKCVMDNAINAAVNDPRFNPVQYDELKDISIEISVLSIPQRLTFSSGEELKKKLIPNVHGVILKRGFRQSTYLPQVWEQLPDKELFLTQLCLKGGMSPICWKDPSTEVYVYRAYVFSEEH